MLDSKYTIKSRAQLLAFEVITVTVNWEPGGGGGGVRLSFKSRQCVDQITSSRCDLPTSAAYLNHLTFKYY